MDTPIVNTDFGKPARPTLSTAALVFEGRLRDNLRRIPDLTARLARLDHIWRHFLRQPEVFTSKSGVDATMLAYIFDILRHDLPTGG